MKPPRGLSAPEAELWARLAATVTPLRRTKPAASVVPGVAAPPPAPVAVPVTRVKGRIPPPRVPPAPTTPTTPTLGAGSGGGLDSHWDRRLTRAATEPDFTLDLHGHNLEQAHRRLDDGLLQAKAMGARLVLVVTGKSRPVDAADRGDRRGAIRAKILDWLAAGAHGSDIAAVRPAQRKHGGEGAIYLVLRRPR